MQRINSPHTLTLSPLQSKDQPLSRDSGISSGSGNSTAFTFGQGGCGKVSLVVDKSFRQMYVEKTPHDNHLRPRCMQIMHRESKALEELKHPNIVSIINSSADGGRWCDSITLEYGGTDLAKTASPSAAEIIGLHTTSDKKEMLLQTVSALDYLHKNNKIHRDIKPQNILVDAHKKVRLCDFGEMMHFDPDSCDLSPAGTPEYCSPDIYTEAGWTPASDMWSFGCVMYRVLTGHDLFPELANKTKLPMTLYLENNGCVEAYEFEYEDELLDWVYFTIQGRLAENISDPQARALLQNLLSIDPGQRPSASYLCAHPWFKTHQSRLAAVLP